MRLKQAIAATIAMALMSGAHANGAFFQDLGFFVPAAVSGDGSVVAGTLGSEATRWTRSEGFVGLGVLPGDSSSRLAGGFGGQVNFDGTAIVGFSSSSDGSRAFRWTQGEGIASLEDADESLSFQNALAVSADGSVVVGLGSELGGLSEAVRWTLEDGITLLSELSPAGTPRLGSAQGVSADGSTIALRNAGSEAARWTLGSVVTTFGQLPGGFRGSVGNGISGDGSVFFGFSTAADDIRQAYRWTDSEGIVGLGNLPGRSSNAIDSTFDGSVIVGITNNLADGSFAGPFIWDQENGMRDFQSVLVDEFQVDLAGWQLGSALSVSNDGSVIVGQGTNPDGDLVGWVVDLSATSTVAILDQESFGPVGVGSGFNANVGFGGAIDHAQTLTVGASGALEQIDLFLRREDQTTEPLVLDIRTVGSEGFPTTDDSGATVLGSIEIPASEVTLDGDWLEIDVSALGIVIEEGETLALVLQSNQNLGNVAAGYSWLGDQEGSYTGGSSFDRFGAGAWRSVFDDSTRPADLYFRTFVSPLAVPEPTAVAMLTAMAPLLTARKSRSRVRRG